MPEFQLVSDYQPSGDQPEAIEQLVAGLKESLKHHILLGATGTGKTFTIANVIAQVQRPTLVMAHNKTLAAQLYREFRDFFPHNAVEYFVSYYDYYQPEAYIPAPTPSSKKMPKSTTKSTACAYRPPKPSSPGPMWSSWPASAPSTAWATPANMAGPA